MTTKAKMDSVKQLVLRVLEEYPETRNSDTKLYLRCARLLGAETLDDLEHLPLNIVSIHKVRQPIQNKHGLFKSDKKTQEIKEQLELEIKEWMVRV